jgi:hypothetical protein
MSKENLFQTAIPNSTTEGRNLTTFPPKEWKSRPHEQREEFNHEKDHAYAWETKNHEKRESDEEKHGLHEKEHGFCSFFP